MRKPIGTLGLAMVFAVAGCTVEVGGGDDSSTTTSVTDTTATQSLRGDCSAADLTPTVSPDRTLPSMVATMRAEIARAAAACDYAALAELADRNGKGVRFSFGAGTDPVAAWTAAEEGTGGVKPMRALRLLLGLKFGVQELGGASRQYAWPRAHTVDKPTDEMLKEIADTGLYDMATLKQMVDGGTGYLGYRVLITDQGDWTAFVAGD